MEGPSLYLAAEWLAPFVNKVIILGHYETESYLEFKEKVMLVLQNAYRNVFFLFLLICGPVCIYSENCPESSGQINGCEDVENEIIGLNSMRMIESQKPKKLSYYLLTEDFIKSFIKIPTSNVLVHSTTKSSKYLAGRAPVYNRHNEKVGTCSASFLCIKNEAGIYTDIANFLSVDNGLVVTWFTPTTLINLELDTIIHSMVTECLVVASTKVGFNPFYGKTFNMIVSSDQSKIYFNLSEL